MSSETVQLDHVILLLPYQDILHPPDWLTSNFTISPGGRHADNNTENRLILFQDGTYLELIAFIDDDPEKRKGHWWDKPYGVIDFAFTTAGGEAEFGYKALQQRLKHSGSEISYAEPKAGARKTPEGEELKWKVTFPEGVERGSVPFWCHDVTPRERRVPITASNTEHSCGAKGMACVVVELDDETHERVASALPAIAEQTRQEHGLYSIGRPIEVVEIPKPAIVLRKAEAASGRKLRVRWVVRCPGQERRASVERQIGNGTVLIDFEP